MKKLILLWLMLFPIIGFCQLPIASFTCEIDSFIPGECCYVTMQNTSVNALDSTIWWFIGPVAIMGNEVNSFCFSTMGNSEFSTTIDQVAINEFGSDLNSAVDCITVDSIGCYTCCGDSLVFSIPTDLLDPHINDLLIYPNPSNSQIRIQLPDNNLKSTRTRVYDISGRLVHQERFNPNMDVGFLDTGTYVVLVETEEGNYRGTIQKTR